MTSCSTVLASWRKLKLHTQSSSVSRSTRGHLVDIEEETRQELVALQREKELLQAKERENEDAIDEVGRACRSTGCCAGNGA